MSAVLKVVGVTLVEEECVTCGVKFGIPAYLQANRREKGGNFYCPNGHPLVYTKTEVMQLREQLEQEKRRTEFQRQQAQSFNRALVASEERERKLKKRIGNGLCPCCRRSFVNLKRHLTTKHPDYGKEK